jgi:hypothetical protein
VYTRAAQIVDPYAGLVRVDWQSADTASPGTFDAEFVVTLQDGRVITRGPRWPFQLNVRRRVGG